MPIHGGKEAKLPDGKHLADVYPNSALIRYGNDEDLACAASYIIAEVGRASTSMEVLTAPAHDRPFGTALILFAPEKKKPNQ